MCVRFLLPCRTTSIWQFSDVFAHWVLTNKLKIIISFLKESISVQITLSTHFEVLIKPDPSKSHPRSQPHVFPENVVSDVSLNQLTPDSRLDLSFHRVFHSLTAAYMCFSAHFDPVLQSQRTVKKKKKSRKMCVLWGLHVYALGCVSFGTQPSTLHRCWVFLFICINYI